MYQLADALSRELHLDAVAHLVLSHTRRLIPASTAVLFAYDEDSDELWCAHVIGEHDSQFHGVRIPRGQRLSGWVAASERTIVNSDPVLDMGEAARTMRPRLRSCLSTPMMSATRIGWCLNTPTQQQAFNEEHRRVIEVVSRQVAETVRRAIGAARGDSSSLNEQMIGLPNRQQLQRFIHAELSASRNSGGLSLIFMSMRQRPISGRKSRPPSNRVVDAIKRTLRDGDILFRYSSTELVVLLTNTNSDAAVGVVASISSVFLERSQSAGELGDELTAVTLGTASAPLDGTTVEDLVTAARNRQYRDSDSSKPGSVH